MSNPSDPSEPVDNIYPHSMTINGAVIIEQERNIVGFSYSKYDGTGALPLWTWVDDPLMGYSDIPGNTVHSHSLNADGVLCRWWGEDANIPHGAHILGVVGALILSSGKPTTAMAKFIMASLDDDQRRDIMSKYCRGCGRDNSTLDHSCQCENDD